MDVTQLAGGEGSWRVGLLTQHEQRVGKDGADEAVLHHDVQPLHERHNGQDELHSIPKCHVQQPACSTGLEVRPRAQHLCLAAFERAALLQRLPQMVMSLAHAADQVRDGMD